jgi:hypothetical protein
VSGGAVRSCTLGRIVRVVGDGPLCDALATTVRRCDPLLLQFFYEAALDSGKPRPDAMARSVAATLEYAAIQLADDLVDGDCDYLSPPRQRAILLLELQALFMDAALACGIEPGALARAIALLLQVGKAAREEIEIRRWTLPAARRMAFKLNGAQHAAYLELLWADSPLESLAGSVGHDLGVVAHIATDVATGDPRFWALGHGDRAALVRHARGLCDRLADRRIASVDMVVRLAKAQLASPELARAQARARARARSSRVPTVARGIPSRRPMLWYDSPDRRSSRMSRRAGSRARNTGSSAS